MFRFVTKQFCLFQLFRYRFETPKQTEMFFLVSRNKPETDLVSVRTEIYFCLFRRHPTYPSLHSCIQSAFIVSGGRIPGRNWDKSLKSFPPRYSQSSPLTDFTSPSFLSKNGLYRNFKSENSQDYTQKPLRNCTFMNSTSAHDVQSFVHLNSRLLSFMAQVFFWPRIKTLEWRKISISRAGSEN